MITLSVIWQYIKKLPHFLFLIIKDLVMFIRFKKWKDFEYWGIHLYVGMFGAGKTCSMVHDAYKIAKQYPQVTIVTNLKLYYFPAHTRILPLRSPKDITDAPPDTLVLIDEIGTIFNSRDFASSKESVPKILFQHLCQQRKRHMMIYATTQRWNFLDKQLRDITDTVRVTRSHFGHPFSRICTVWRYDAQDYDKAYANPLLPLVPLRGDVYVQTDEARKRYDTTELIEGLLKAEYIPDDQIAQNRGDADPVISGTPLKRKEKRQVYRAQKRL